MVRDGVQEREPLQNGAHFQGFEMRHRIGQRDTDAAPGQGNHKPVSLQPPKSLANWDMARGEFVCDLFLS